MNFPEKKKNKLETMSLYQRITGNILDRKRKLNRNNKKDEIYNQKETTEIGEI